MHCASGKYVAWCVAKLYIFPMCVGEGISASAFAYMYTLHTASILRSKEQLKDL